MLRPSADMAALVPVLFLVCLFVLLAHWLGLAWYLLAIRPMESDRAFDSLYPWYWLADRRDGGGHPTATLWVCSVSWALTVMTNLDPQHEDRQCLWSDQLVLQPLTERVFSARHLATVHSCHSPLFASCTVSTRHCSPVAPPTHTPYRPTVKAPSRSTC